MQRIVHKTTSFKKAEEWDILQQRKMTPAQRQKIALILKKMVYGVKQPDVRETHRIVKKPRMENR